MASTKHDPGITYTATELLHLLEFNIAQIHVRGQSYSIEGRTLTSADLGELYKQREKLKDEVEKASSVTGTLTALADFGEQ